MDFKWMINRLKAMGAREIAWRARRKWLERREFRVFNNKARVIDRIFDQRFSDLNADYSWLGIVKENNEYSIDSRIELLADYNYDYYKTRWHAGFQTEKQWNLVPSSKVNASELTVPGDLRTNWELNRHHQFAVVAKCYYASRDKSYLKELSYLFYDWNQANPFLWGPEWTSAMEIGIRLINWLYTAAFLDEAEDAKELVRDIEIGCINMAVYVARHRSRFSSANNHAIVEAAALGIAGFVFNNKEWQQVAFRVLDKELMLQNNIDGTNKEQALHYQTFGMEAFALYLHVRSVTKKNIPKEWKEILSGCCNYVRNCRVKKDVYVEFGDDDEGIIFNLCSYKPCHPDYVLAFYDLLFDNDDSWCCPNYKNETLCWLFPADMIERLNAKLTRKPSADLMCPDGGVSIVRFDDRTVWAIDHGPLGYAPLYAHGHADALS